jgi:hypothetical protein
MHSLIEPRPDRRLICSQGLEQLRIIKQSVLHTCERWLCEDECAKGPEFSAPMSRACAGA